MSGVEGPDLTIWNLYLASSSLALAQKVPSPSNFHAVLTVPSLPETPHLSPAEGSSQPQLQMGSSKKRAKVDDADDGDYAEGQKSPTAKRRRTGKRDPWSDEEALFGPKSKLLGVDLKSYFQNPMAWECLSEEEKKEIISLLPSGLVLEDGKPPMEFLKYSTNWGDALRVFQADLEAGRYEPEWLAQAAEAMEERAAGKFDDAKEKHFEEYWGQKAQLESHMLTSEQSKIRLEELVSEGIFKVGDIWSYGRAFGRGKAAVLIEKDIELVKVTEDEVLKFLVAPGQRKSITKPGSGDKPKSREPKDYSINSVALRSDCINSLHTPEQLPASGGISTAHSSDWKDYKKAVSGSECIVPSGTLDQLASSASGDGSTISDRSEHVTGATAPGSVPFIKATDANKSSISLHASTAAVSNTDSPPSSLSTHSTSPDFSTSEFQAGSQNYHTRTSERKRTLTSKAQRNAPTIPSSSSTSPTVYELDTLPNLERKLIETDGRLPNWTGKTNAWKSIRCKRGNEDLGTLWEILEHRMKKGVIYA